MFNTKDRHAIDYYQLLGLRRNCTPSDIKKQYHKLALQWHPDKNEDEQSKAKFAQINEAYSVLADKKKRSLYDRYGSVGLELDQECKDFASSGLGTLFSKSGFRGTDRSAFEILKDIFEENDDNYFFGQYGSFGINENLKNQMKDFIEDNVISTDEEDDFCKKYKPTFMNSDFLKSTSYVRGKLDPRTSGAQSFSFMSYSAGDGNMYTKTTETSMKNGKVQQTMKERLQKGEHVMENEQNNEFNLNDYPKDKYSFLSGLTEDNSNEFSLFGTPGISKRSKDITKKK